MYGCCMHVWTQMVNLPFSRSDTQNSVGSLECANSKVVTPNSTAYVCVCVYKFELHFLSISISWPTHHWKTPKPNESNHDLWLEVDRQSLRCAIVHQQTI